MTTMADLVNAARSNAFGSMPEVLNIIADDVAAGATSIELDMDVTGIQEGNILSCGLNVWYVRSVNATTRIVTVIPGRQGAPSPAVGAGSVVYIQPEVTDWFLFGAVNDAIRAMSSPLMGLYKRATWTASTDSTYQTYAIPEAAQSMLSLIGVRYRETSNPDSWIALESRAYEVQRSQNVIRVRRNIPASAELEFRYRAPFTVATALTDNPVTVCGLADSMLDIPPLGAAAQVARSMEGRRNQVQVQGDPRRAEEVQQTGNLRLASSWDVDFAERCNQEYARLLSVESFRRDL